MLINWCQVANWDLSASLALRDYWATWELGKNCGSKCWTRDESHGCISAYIIGVFSNLRIPPFKRRYELHHKNVLKNKYVPTDELVSSWLVSLLSCLSLYSRNLSPSVYKILHQIELFTANKLSGKCAWEANREVCEHQSWLLTHLNICESLSLIIFPDAVKIWKAHKVTQKRASGICSLCLFLYFCSSICS